MALFTPLFNAEQKEMYAFYNRKINALQRSVNHLSSFESLTDKQSSTLKLRKKDLAVFKGKRTKLENMCRMF